MTQTIITDDWRKIAEAMALYLRKTRDKPRDASDMLELDQLIKSYIKLDPKFSPTLTEG